MGIVSCLVCKGKGVIWEEENMGEQYPYPVPYGIPYLIRDDTPAFTVVQSDEFRRRFPFANL